ncbi:MAG: 2OG-Fe(II) oxygenase [Blastocatellia bacterium]
MPNPDFFARLGLLTIKGFLDDELCIRLLSEADSNRGVPATIRQGSATTLDESVRQTMRVKVTALSKSLVKTRLLALRPRLESHFQIALKGIEGPQFLVYTVGSFYKQHQDSTTEPGTLEYAEARKVSVVVFLNNESDEPKPNCYGGGSLRLYGIMSDPPWEKCGFPLIGEKGLLIAFRSDVIHEVTPVTHGTRYAAVNWFS